MTTKEFNKLVEESLDKIRNTLIKKGAEYNMDDQDRLDCFKKAAVLMNSSVSEAVYGMMVKHVISLADFVSSGKNYSEEKFNEKIFDNLCYLLLLKAAMIDDGRIEPEYGVFRTPEFHMSEKK